MTSRDYVDLIATLNVQIQKLLADALGNGAIVILFVEPIPKLVKSRFKTLFLCTGNSARSILAEYLLRKVDKDRFEVYSAGVNPKGPPHSMALAILRDNFQIDASNARSKSMEEFKDVEFDFVITVSDNAREACPVWPGRPIIAHWSSPDPSKTEGDEGAIKEAFWKVAQQINRRVELLVALPFEKLDALRLEAETKAIGQ